METLFCCRNTIEQEVRDQVSGSDSGPNELLNFGRFNFSGPQSPSL